MSRAPDCFIFIILVLFFPLASKLNRGTVKFQHPLYSHCQVLCRLHNCFHALHGPLMDWFEAAPLSKLEQVASLVSIFTYMHQHGLWDSEALFRDNACFEKRLFLTSKYAPARRPVPPAGRRCIPEEQFLHIMR